MAKISDIQREKELIGVFMLSRLALDTAIEENFTAEECINNENKTILEFILEEARFNLEFIPSTHYIIDKLELTKEKEIKKLQLTLNRYKKMVEREIINDEQFIDITKRNIIKLRDYYTKRKVLNVIKNGLDEIELPSRELISLLQTDLNNIEINDGLIVEVSVHSGFKQLKEEMKYQVEHGLEFGVKTYFRDFDKMVGDNFSPGSYSMIVGRPSQYKSGLALNISYNQAENGIPVAFFSHEMEVNDVYRRILARKTKIEMSKLKKPKTLTEKEWDILDKAIEEVKEMPLFVIDGSKLNISHMDSIIAYLKAKYDIKIAWFDYFQLIRKKNNSIATDEGDFAEVSEELRMIPKKHDIALIALSQANRSCEARDNKRPTLADIRSTGKAEMDSHNVFYVYRDEFYYGTKSEVPNHMEIGAIKVREGELKKVLLHFNGGIATLGNADPMVLVDKPSDYIGSANLFE